MGEFSRYVAERIWVIIGGDIDAAPTDSAQETLRQLLAREDDLE